ncbi:MAG: NUDIX hydrolase, partial [Schleiferiaceae bacterium]
MKALTAAGGWVKNGRGEVLWIYRLGHWDLPKGKLESGENMEE